MFPLVPKTMRESSDTDRATVSYDHVSAEGVGAGLTIRLEEVVSPSLST